MKIIFGDDGFRSIYGREFMSKKFLKVFSYTLKEFFKEKKQINFAIGYDTRFSNKEVFNQIIKFLNKNIKIYNFGVISLGQLSYEIKTNNYDFGIMITASHFHYSFNGIKILNINGEKISSYIENKLEKKILFNLKNIQKINFLSETKKINFPKSNYYKNFIKYKSKIKKKYLIDCANGSASLFFKNNHFNNFKIINDKPNGKNINYKCGAYYYSKNSLNFNSDYSIHFDGDADRVIIKSKKYGDLSSEFLIYAYCYKNKNSNIVKKIVTSVIVNSSLSKLLKLIGFKLYTSKVGDRNVYNLMKKNRSTICFEPSGHYCFNKYSNTMDGIYSFFIFLPILEDDRLMNICSKNFYLRKRISISFKPKKSFSLKKLHKLNKTLKSKIKYKFENILLRKSIWSKSLRLYYDFDEKNEFQKFKKILKDI